MKQKEKLTKKKDMCLAVADSIHKINPTLTQINEALAGVWDTAYAEAWNDCTLFHKKLRENTERILAKDFDKLRTQIEDKIHSNK